MDIGATLRQATAHHQAGRLAQAQALYRQVLAAAPGQPDALHLLGVLAHQTGHHREAEAMIRQAIAGAPLAAAFQVSLGHVLRAQGNAAAAEACLRAALRVAPAQPQVMNALALALVGQGKHADALSLFDAALQAAPGYANALVNRANCLASLEDFPAAAAAFAAAVAALPADVALRVAQARVALRLERAADAVAALQAALALAPAHAEALHILAQAYAAQERPDLALHYLRLACEQAPENAEAWYEMGLAYRELGRWPEAVAPHQEAVRLNPEDANLRSCYAYALLANGDFAQGWQEFRWRVKKPGNVRLREPEWDGAPTSQTVIIHAEQGVGDTLQFCRFIPAAGALARVVVACPPSLQRLLQGLPNVAQVAVGKPVPAYDMHCPLMSLPAVLGVAPAHFADTVPYLRAAPDDVAAWQARLAHLPGRRVGVVWAGNPAYPADRKRSLKFATLAPLLDAPGVAFVSLQLGEAAAEGAGRFTFDAAPFIGDYADTAAAIEALDVLISVDTSAAHLAGALGRPVWLLNRADTDWRWLLERSDSPWYPSMRIFRQTAPGDWGAVIEQVRASF